MLDDFIEINGLNARIVNKVATGKNSAKCELLLRESAADLPLLLIYLCKDSVDMKKVGKRFPDKLREPSAKDALYITGYKKEFMPPISIYGVIVLLDKRAAEEETLCFPVDEEKTLVISPDEIKEANENYMIDDIVR